MKLFKSLLVAPAALGLMTPLAVSASEVNLNDISNYSDVDSIEFANSFGKDEVNEKKLIAGGEGLISGSSHDGGFSETTKASFTADFLLGAVDDSDEGATTDKFMAGYSFQIDLNTSFVDGDSLDISIDAGNSKPEGDNTSGIGATDGITELDGNSTGDALNVDGVSYTFPLGDATFFVGDNTDGSMLFTTACTYGGITNTLDDCGNVNAGPTGGGLAAGASYDFGNGFAVALGYQNVDGEEDQGFMTKESTDTFALNASYTGDNFGISYTGASIEDGEAAEDQDVYGALNAYYTPDSAAIPSISVGYEVGEDASKTTLDEITSFFLGLQWDEVGPGSLGVAMGHSSTVEGTDEEYMYEAYYSYSVNDGMTITPVIYTKDNATAGQDDTTGFLVKTSFSF